MRAKELAARAFSTRYEALKVSHAAALRVNGQRKKALVEGGRQDDDDPVGHTLAAMLAQMGFRESLAVAHHASYGESEEAVVASDTPEAERLFLQYFDGIRAVKFRHVRLQAGALKSAIMSANTLMEIGEVNVNGMKALL